jgi:Skp family chaperone for outer membrane proteins
MDMSTEEIHDPEQPTETPQPESGGAPTSKPNEPNLADELREFGKQIENMFQAVRTSPRGKEVEQQLTAAWRDVEKGINTAIAKAQSSDIKGTVQGTAQYAADEAQSGLARGLRSLNQWMAQKLRQIDENRKKREAEASYAATHASAVDEVAERFNNAPVFGKDIHVPAAPIPAPPGESAGAADNPIADRFNDHPISFGEPDKAK